MLTKYVYCVKNGWFTAPPGTWSNFLPTLPIVKSLTVNILVVEICGSQGSSLIKYALEASIKNLIQNMGQKNNFVQMGSGGIGTQFSVEKIPSRIPNPTHNDVFNRLSANLSHVPQKRKYNKSTVNTGACIREHNRDRIFNQIVPKPVETGAGKTPTFSRASAL